MQLDALASWACDPRQSRGRRVAEAAAPPRNEHQRDRDRIVHSTAFRRLVYKTQVFINHEGDLFRTRLTHSLEVAQLARSAARALALNEDLVEAIALAHDLGHTPFGHAGQDALHACMREHGGFEHNLQSLRVVDRLEIRYASFDGLNLCFETREGILKHCSARNARRLVAAEPKSPAQRFIDGSQPSLEAQLVNLADELAYSAHDIDDGVRSGLLDEDQIMQVPLLHHWQTQTLQEHPGLLGRRLLGETLRRMLSAQVHDLVHCTQSAVQALAPTNSDAVRALPPLAALSTAMRLQTTQLKHFLFEALYRHPQVQQVTDQAKTVVTELFRVYTEDPLQMPLEHAQAARSGQHQALPRTVADYIAGMTDRFALREYLRLTGRQPFADALQRSAQ